ncbi:hypothetical protein DB347_20510 [Opitutaceae bacterium EW11]|nr:hypothetical protein DB347_20510 [Opitutaceae bacterium EW11]
MKRIPSSFSVRTFVAVSALIGAGLLVMFAVANRVAAAGLETPSARKAVPDFAVQTLDGKTWSLAAKKGQVVLINLFATWCPPCRAEMPGLVQTISIYGTKGVAALALSVDEGGADVVRPFAAKYKMSFPVALQGAGPSPADGVSSIPVTLLIDRDGRLARTYVGMVSESQLTRDLDALLQEKP